MPRNINPSVLAQLTSDSLQPSMFVMLTFKTATVYIWTGQGTVEFNGQSWVGLGDLLSISTVESGSTVDARGISIAISGLDSTLLADCMGEFVLGLPAAVYLALWETTAGAPLYIPELSLIPFPITTWLGRMDQPTVNVSGTEATIAVNCESRLIDLNIPPDRRYTQEDQQRYYPGDLGFSFVDGIMEVTIYWGGVPNGTNNI